MQNRRRLDSLNLETSASTTSMVGEPDGAQPHGMQVYYRCSIKYGNVKLYLCGLGAQNKVQPSCLSWLTTLYIRSSSVSNDKYISLLYFTNAAAVDESFSDVFGRVVGDWMNPMLSGSSFHPNSIRDTQDEGQELYLHFFHEQLRREGIDELAFEEER